jgi:uncharacterized Rossmann fold enzyme
MLPALWIERLRLSSIYPVFNLSLVLSPQDRQANLLSSSIIENLKTNNTNAILQIIREAEIFIQGIEADIERLDNRLVEIIGLREEILLAAVDADEALIEEKIIQTDYDQIQALLRNIEMLYNTTMIELIYRNVLSQISLAE